ncbi:MAG: chemotaxis protein CheW [Bryobacteraceae bacterium]
MPSPNDAGVETRTAGLQWLRCSAAGGHYLLPAHRIAGIHRGESVRPSWDAGGPAGWMETPQGRVPVHRLSRLLGQPDDETLFPAVMTLEGSQGTWAISASRVSRVTASVEAIPLPPIAAGVWRLASEAMVMDGAVELCLDTGRLEDVAFGHAAKPAGAEPAPAVPPATPVAAGKASGTGRILTFTLPGDPFRGALLTLAVSFTQVLELTGALPMAEIPGAPEHLLGVTIWRGRTVPVVDLAYCLGGERANAPGARLLVARAARSAMPICFPVDETSGTVAAAALCERASEPWQARVPCVRAAFDASGVPMLVPDFDTLLRAGGS